jgi:hypothetical protein
MTAEDLTQRVLAEGIVTLESAEWRQLEDSFDAVERHDTFIAGDLVIARSDGVLVAVEAPTPDKRVIRRLADEGEARAFVRERLDTYERMWDGCGCKVDYYR